jgi:capsular exopolysaccharide synthesis family protein
LEIERSALMQLVAEVTSASTSPDDPPSYRRLAGFPTLLRSSTASDLMRTMNRLEDERSALLTRRQPTDPEVRALTSRISQLEGELRGTVTAYVDGLTNQIRHIETQLSVYQRDAARVPEMEARMGRLTRQAKTLEDVYSTLKARLTEAEVLYAVEDPSVRIVDAATASIQPITGLRAFILMAWTGGGLLLGLALAFAKEYRDGSIRSRSDLQVAAGVPVIGMIPRMGHSVASFPSKALAKTRALPATGDSARPSASAVVVRSPDNVSQPVPMLTGLTRMSMIAAEAYRRLHLNMLRSRPGISTRVFLVTSALPGDGKTTTAVNLAVTLAQRGYKIALIDGDLRQGPLQAIFGVESGPALVDILSAESRSDFATFMRNVTKVPNVSRKSGLDLLPAGRSPLDPAILLDSPRLPELMAWVKSTYDIVVMDSPPAAIVTDALALGAYADGVILVARSGVTPFDALQYVAAQFRSAQIAVLGTVLNDIDIGDSSRHEAGFQWYEYGKDYFTPTTSKV